MHRYKTEFGFVLQNRDVLVDDVRVRGIGKTEFEKSDHTDLEDEPANPVDPRPKPVETAQVFFDDRYIQTDVFKMEDLRPGNYFDQTKLV